jgi:DNA-binding MarR family transcriptional regulator
MVKRRPQTALDDGSTPESDAVVLTARLGDRLSMEAELMFRGYGITLLQFNVLRILYVRDPDRKGISRGALESRLVRRVPDVTRLLDRLEAAGLIERNRPDGDQRTVLATLTDKGWKLVEETHAPLLALNRAQLGHLTRDELRRFITLLRKASERPSLVPSIAQASRGTKSRTAARRNLIAQGRMT